MTKRAFRTAAVAIVAFSLIAGACFQIRFIKFEPKALSPGQSGVLKIELYPLSGNENVVAHTFVLVGYESADLAYYLTGVFDELGNFGGPYTNVDDTSLATYLRTGTNCESNGVSASEVTGLTWIATRTVVEVDSSAAGISIKNLVKLYFTRLAADNGERGNIVVFSGAWNDDGDLIEEGGEIVCTAAVFTSYAFRA